MSTPARTPRVEAVALEPTLVELLFASEAVGVALVDRELRYVRVNAALAAMNGHPVEAHLGRSVSAVLPPEAVAALEGALRSVLAGERLTDVPISGVMGGSERHFLASYWPVPGEDGGNGGVLALVVERTPADAALRKAIGVAEAARAEAERDRDRTARLQSLTAALAGARTVEDVAGVVVAEAVAAAGAASGALVLRDPQRPGEAIIMQQTGLATAMARDFARFPIDRPSPTAECVRTGEARFLDSRYALDIAYPALAGMWAGLGTNALAVVPLAIAGETAGALGFTFAASHPFPPAERDFFLSLAHQASQALERARLLEAELAARRRAEAAARRALALQQVGGALASAITAREVAEVVVRHGRAAVGASAGSLAAFVADAAEFHTLASEGYADDTTRRFQHFPLVPGRPLSDAVISDRPTYVTSLEEARERYPFMVDALRDTRFEAYVALPVRAGGRAAAGLGFSFAGQREFGPEERAFLETLAWQAGQALERGQLVDAERTARAEAEAASRTKSQFLATMSHELRTPLNAIGGHVQLVEMELHGPLTAAQRDALARVQRAQHHLLGLINDVLNFARLESGRVEYDLRPVDVRDVVTDVLPLIEPQVAARGLTLEVRLPDASGAPVRVRADREKLGQILLNLLSNAVKFTPPGGRIVVEMPERADGSAPRRWAFLRVSDTGIGIPQDKLETVFEPFVQVGRGYAQEASGTGLGLSISRDLARGMGGDLRARSTPGAGSAFTVTLQRVLDESAGP